MITLGLLTRWDWILMAIPEGPLFSVAGFDLFHTKASIFSFVQIIEHFLSHHLWMVWGGIFAAYLFIVWWGKFLNNLHPLLIADVHMLAGAFLSVILDLLFFGNLQDSFHIRVADLFSINITISGMVLVVGITYLLFQLNRSWHLKSQYRLNPYLVPKVNLSALPRGVDNIHIDVLLSNKLTNSCKTFINNLIPIVVHEFQAGKRKVHVPKDQLKALHNIFSQTLELTLRRAKESGEKEIVDLMIISLFKFIHEEVARAVGSYANQRTDLREEGMVGEKRQRFNDYISRHKEDVSSTVNEIILGLLKEHQSQPLSQVLKNSLGIKESFSSQLTQTPLTLCGHNRSELVLLKNYMLTGLLRQDENHFHEIERVLSNIFRPYLLLITQESDERVSEVVDEYVNEIMEILLQPSILTGTKNITKLLDINWTKEKIKEFAAEGKKDKKRALEKHLQFQIGVFRRVENELSRSSISAWLVASYQVKELLSKRSDLSPSLLMKILVTADDKIQLVERVNKNSSPQSRIPDVEMINDAWDTIHTQCHQFIHDHLVKIMKDFVRYRHDLLVHNQLLQAYAQISLLTDERDIQTSRANYTLHDFSASSELDNDLGQVRSHIIIKADLRGSTQVTDKLVELSLNPATHFERNFFTPVNKLIEAYGAEKVFIEGDAIILILNEYDNKKSNRQIASRACGLAAHILRVVATQNKELKCYALPELELGIGIAFCNTPPRYLFDGDHRITISPGINRADRLSACTWSIREWLEKQSVVMNQVEVYQPSESAEAIGEKAQKDMVFNLNGILIEDDIFKKLQQEVNLKPVLNKISSMQDSKLFALVFPDLAGSIHRMIVRKAPVKLYDQSYNVKNCPVVKNRYFYEVVYQKDILDQLRK
ncbi:MAG: hypothetical protein GQ470_02215 [Gammaproteobacteria bacterium]|nr:hypothetical protein [Gammaproteobacteria bacterium]